MSWGHATSKDLLVWRYAPVHTALKPDKKYDKAGVFTGCLGPFTQKDEMSIFYTSIKSLPFHWTAPAPRDNAGLALAMSSDDGLTWCKSNNNPILQGEPAGLDVTGFRDPYLAEWDSLDRLRGTKSMYGLISGGIKDKGPTTFLYTVNPSNIMQWEYLGPLVDIPLRWQPSPKWEYNYGVNWECVNFMTLATGLFAWEVLILGSEGDVPPEHLVGLNLPPGLPPRTTRGQQWMAGDLVRTENGIRMKYKHGGILDHGPYYAANSFVDPVTGRRIVYGWIPEEDCTQTHAHQKGWNGCQAAPREIFLQAIPNVSGALQSLLTDITSIECVPQYDGLMTVYTLGIRPIRELEKSRSNADTTKSLASLLLPESTTAAATTKHVANTITPTWELTSTISVDPITCTAVGLHICHSRDLSTRTTITFSPNNERISVNRSRSAPQHPEFNSCTESGPFTLFETTADGHQISEKLQIHIISDGDVLEVFANERFALATMIYSGNYEDNGGITAFAEGDTAGCVEFEELTVWDGLNGGKSCVVYEGEEDSDGEDFPVQRITSRA